MNNLFSECSSLKYLDFNKFVAKNDIKTDKMFFYCKINTSELICYDEKILKATEYRDYK